MKMNCGEYNLKKNIKFLNQNETIIIDPGIVNLCISYPKQKRVWLFHFENIYDLLRNEEFKSVFKQFETIQNLNIICENQFLKKNILLQGILCGYIYSLLNVNKFFWFQPYLKNEYLFKKHKYKYRKIKSNKCFLKQPIEFINSLNEWTIYEFKNKLYTENTFLNYKNIKKKDDIIDCVIMSEFLKADY
jgi:hypothetical protein